MIAVYNLDQATWLPPTNITIRSGGIFQVLLNNTGTMFVSGDVNTIPSSFDFSVASLDILEDVSFTILNAQSEIFSLLLFTAPDFTQFLYGAGFGLYFAEMDGTSPAVWTQGGHNLLYNYFTGTGYDILYLTGGKGLNGVNM